MSYITNHKQQFEDLKFQIANQDQLRRQANGGNSILFSYPPNEEHLYIEKARELYPENVVFIDVSKLFVKFIALILYMKMSKTMKENKLFNKLTIKEVLLELRKIKKTFIDENTNILSEITKKQRQILECFKLDIT